MEEIILNGVVKEGPLFSPWMMKPNVQKVVTGLTDNNRFRKTWRNRVDPRPRGNFRQNIQYIPPGLTAYVYEYVEKPRRNTFASTHTWLFLWLIKEPGDGFPTMLGPLSLNSTQKSPVYNFTKKEREKKNPSEIVWQVLVMPFWEDQLNICL